ncbi:MAG: hypothetical protein ABJN98_18920 [Roseibium sp.]
MTNFQFKVSFLGVIFLLILCGDNPVHACADGPDFYQVANVAPTDVLNVRSGPGVKFGIVSQLSHDATNLQNVDQVPISCDDLSHLNAFERQNFWTKIVWRSEGDLIVGWVKTRFLSEQGYD